MIEIVEIRESFPILSRKVNGKDLVYFDNGASTQKPKAVINAIEKCLKEEYSNVHRGVHFLSGLATDKFEESRIAFKKFINAEHAHEIIFTKGTTDSINIIAGSFSSLLKSGDEIIISELEHHSNIVPWQLCCERSGATLKKIPIRDSGDLNIEAFERLLSNKTKIVAVSHISNTLGTINPIEKIIKMSHKVGAKVLVDGAQAISHLPLNMQKLNVDFYCFSAHKMYGPSGVGVLYGKEKNLNNLPPYQGGGAMIKEVGFEKTTYNELPYKFEAGTPNIEAVISCKSSIDFMCSIGMEKIVTYESGLLQYTTKKLTEIEGVKIYGKSEKKSAIISFNIDGIHHYDLGVLLDKMGVAVRTGHHCTQPLMKRFKIPGTVRISLAIYNTKNEVDTCIAAIKKAKLMLL